MSCEHRVDLVAQRSKNYTAFWCRNCLCLVRMTNDQILALYEKDKSEQPADSQTEKPPVT